MFGLRKIRSMKRHVVILFVLCVFYAFANQAVDDALQSVIQNGCLSNRRAAGQIEEWGVPERLFQEPSFTNLVSILNQELVNCDFAYVRGGINQMWKCCLSRFFGAMVWAGVSSCGS